MSVTILTVTVHGSAFVNFVFNVFFSLFFFFPVGKSGISEKDNSEDEIEEETQRVITILRQ